MLTKKAEIKSEGGHQRPQFQKQCQATVVCPLSPLPLAPATTNAIIFTIINIAITAIMTHLWHLRSTLPLTLRPGPLNDSPHCPHVQTQVAGSRVGTTYLGTPEFHTGHAAIGPLPSQGPLSHSPLGPHL